MDMLLHGGDGLATGRCAVEVGVDAVIASPPPVPPIPSFPTPPARSLPHYLHHHFVAFGISIRSSCRCRLISIWPFLFAVCWPQLPHNCQQCSHSTPSPLSPPLVRPSHLSASLRWTGHRTVWCCQAAGGGPTGRRCSSGGCWGGQGCAWCRCPTGSGTRARGPRSRRPACAGCCWSRAEQRARDPLTRSSRLAPGASRAPGSSERPHSARAHPFPSPTRRPIETTGPAPCTVCLSTLREGVGGSAGFDLVRGVAR